MSSGGKGNLSHLFSIDLTLAGRQKTTLQLPKWLLLTPGEMGRPCPYWLMVQIQAGMRPFLMSPWHGERRVLMRVEVQDLHLASMTL
jgi:hypothetical protein